MYLWIEGNLTLSTHPQNFATKEHSYSDVASRALECEGKETTDDLAKKCGPHFRVGGRSK